MSRIHARLAIPLSLLCCLPAMPAAALLPPGVIPSTPATDGKMATATRRRGTEIPKIKTGDDFILTTTALITGGTFTGLPTGHPSWPSQALQVQGAVHG